MAALEIIGTGGSVEAASIAAGSGAELTGKSTSGAERGPIPKSSSARIRVLLLFLLGCAEAVVDGLEGTALDALLVCRGMKFDTSFSASALRDLTFFAGLSSWL